MESYESPAEDEKIFNLMYTQSLWIPQSTVGGLILSIKCLYLMGTWSYPWYVARKWGSQRFDKGHGHLVLVDIFIWPNGQRVILTSHKNDTAFYESYCFIVHVGNDKGFHGYIVSA